MRVHLVGVSGTGMGQLALLLRDAHWRKEPQFFDDFGASREDVVILTSVEHDHVDIYPTAHVYEAQPRACASASSRLPDPREARSQVGERPPPRDKTGPIIPAAVPVFSDDPRTPHRRC